MAIIALTYDNTTGKILAQLIGSAQLADGAVTSAKFAANIIATPHILNQGLLSASFASGQIAWMHQATPSTLSGQLGSGVVGLFHLAPWSSGQIIVGQGTTVTPILQARQAAIGFVIDGGGAVITSGLKGLIEVPFPATMARCTVLGDVSGNIDLDISKVPYASYPLVSSACGSGLKPHTSGDIKYQDTALTAWGKSIASGDILGFWANNASSIQRCTISLSVYR